MNLKEKMIEKLQKREDYDALFLARAYAPSSYDDAIVLQDGGYVYQVLLVNTMDAAPWVLDPLLIVVTAKDMDEDHVDVKVKVHHASELTSVTNAFQQWCMRDAAKRLKCAGIDEEAKILWDRAKEIRI